jgi:hypothetical protein
MFYSPPDLPPWTRPFPIARAIFPILPWRRDGAKLEADVDDEVGTGFFIGVYADRGLFATAAHNVQRQGDPEMYCVMIPAKGRTMVTCQVGRRWFHPTADCAICKVAVSELEGERPSPLPLDHRPLRAGQRVVSVGWPEVGRTIREVEGGLPGLGLDWNMRAVAGTVNERLASGYIRKGFPVWSTTCDALGGHSGGPLFAEGRSGVCGILAEGGEGHGVFVDIQAVRDILAQHGLRRRGGAP